MITATHRFNLQSIVKTTQDRPPALAVDLVSIAAHAYAADRSVRRGRPWKRHLRVSARVTGVLPWKRQRLELESALNLLTDDTWDLELVEGRPALPEESQGWLIRANEKRMEAVALFSGGLDSFAGAAIWLNDHPHQVLGLLSVSSSSVVGKIQRGLAQLLSTAYPNRVIHLTVPLNLLGAPAGERSQRTRGLVYTAFASAAAHCAGTKRVLIFENGYGAINPRLVDHQEGAQSTKSTHPFVIGLLESIYIKAGIAVHIDLPHVSETKAELVRKVPEVLRQAICMTVSCDGFPLRRLDAKQCGYCSSCILRQQALRKAGLKSFDRNDYSELPFDTGNRSTQLLLMAYQASQFAGITDDTHDTIPDLVRRWPEIGLGEKVQLSLNQIERVEMLRRYGLEWQALVTEDRALGARLGWMVTS